MSVSKTMELYAGAYNCAQSVAAGFDGDQDLVDSLKKAGGGKAEGGLCGAVYTAALMCGDENIAKVKQSFEKQVGNLECRAIKKAGAVPCVGCVEIAAKLLEEYK